MPEHPLAAVSAFVDFKRFGILPFEGGTFDQPADFMEELRFVADEFNKAEAKRIEKAQKAKR